MSDQDPTVRRPAVCLRPVEPADLPTLYENQCDPEGSRMAAVIPRTADNFYEHWRTVLADERIIPRAILADGQLVGAISRFRADDLDMVGYWIAREHWGKGIATRALELFLQEVTTRPLHARVASHNAASLRVLERCGFTITGRTHEPATDRYLAAEVISLILR